MIKINGKESNYQIQFTYEDRNQVDIFSQKIGNDFCGKFLETCYIPTFENKVIFLVGLGKRGEIKEDQIKEAFARASKEMKVHNVLQFSIHIENLIEDFALNIIREAVEGTVLGLYEFKSYKRDKVKEKEFNISINGIKKELEEEANGLLKESIHLVEGVIFARNMVNAPGNELRPDDFADEITKLFQETSVKVEKLSYDKIKELGMNGLVSVGASSEYLPCFMVLKYMGNPNSKEIIGLVGKGVTSDTGGYCLKPPGSMLGIKGDMAGAASVVGSIYGLAKNNKKTNVIGFIPICENRISRGSLLPGDVITSLSGRTIEVINTDAEGRLILADAVTYAVEVEKVTTLLDIATLTGAVVSMFGFTTAGVISNCDKLWTKLEKAYLNSGERYWRLPTYPEYEKMIRSEIADLKNQGEAYCGTITAGLFIREFANGIPHIHIDIAGTAWVDTPFFEYQSKGGTGAGVTTMYYFCCL